MVNPFKEAVKDHKRFNALAGADKFEDALLGSRMKMTSRHLSAGYCVELPGTKSSSRPVLTPSRTAPPPPPEDHLQAFSFPGRELFTVRRVVSRPIPFVNSIRTRPRQQIREKKAFLSASRDPTFPLRILNRCRWTEAGL
jgi:hypothetical protein